MRSLPLPALAVSLALALGACATNPASEVLPGEQSATGTARQVVNGVGTPVHALIKGATCVATTVVAIPLASLAQVSGEPQSRQEEAYQAVGRTCGGDYVLGAPSERLPAAEPPPAE